MTDIDLLGQLLDTFRTRAQNAAEDASLALSLGKTELAAYDAGRETAYRGAARAVEYQIAKIADYQQVYLP